MTVITRHRYGRRKVEEVVNRYGEILFRIYNPLSGKTERFRTKEEAEDLVGYLEHFFSDIV